MKQLLIITLFFVTTSNLFAQNTFPTTGKVGIGTTTPERELEIKDGGVIIRGLAPNLTLKKTTPGFGSWLDIAAADCNGCYSKFAKKGSIVMRAVSYHGDFYITNPGNTGITFATGNWNSAGNPQKERMTITNTGNVGIGTTTPDAKLEVIGGTGWFADPTLELKSNSSASAWSLIHLKGGTFDNTNDYMIGRGYKTYNQGRALTFHVPSRTNFYGGSGNLPQIAFVSSGANTLGYIQSETGNWYMKGNVGIGTTTPDAKLAVNGRIHTKEVKVDLIGWADYVFHEDYNLLTLQQVEDHIAQKRHLPNIPSAAEVAENGILLGEMNAKLLEKIEELTLYTIAQEKKIKELKSENNQQSTINNQLKTSNQNLEARLARIEELLKKK